MTLHRWKDIKKGSLTDKRVAELEKKVTDELLDMSLRDLRESLGITQQALAEAVGMAQSEVSRLERREDHHVSTLRKVVEALGGELEISAVFGKKRVRVA
jgi:predicted transcriptional regulator